ncbi:MAG: GspH/FimT family pseudopilin, partial [Luteibacter sp.]
GHRCTPGGRWHLGWIVVDGSIVLSAHAALPGRLATRSSQARPHITFDEAGRAPGGNDTVTLCVRHRPATAVSLVISSAGRIHAEPPDRPSAAACASSRENNR